MKVKDLINILNNLDSEKEIEVLGYINSNIDGGSIFGDSNCNMEVREGEKSIIIEIDGNSDSKNGWCE